MSTLSSTIRVRKHDLAQAQAEIEQLLLAYHKAVIREEEIENNTKQTLLELQELKHKLLSEIDRPSEVLKEDMRAVFMKWRPVLEEQMGTALTEISCDYGKVGIKDSKLAIVFAEQDKEADILQRLKDRGLDQFIVHKQRIDKQLMLRCAEDESMAKQLEQVGIRAQKKEEFYIKVKP